MTLLKKLRKSRFIALFLSIILLCSCKVENRYTEIVEINGSLWGNNQEITFVMKCDTVGYSGDMYLLLNCFNNVNIDSIPLILEITNPHKMMWSDTLSVEFSESTNSLYKIKKEAKILSNCKFNVEGAYIFKIKQIYDTPLNGILEVGMVIK